MSLHTLTRRAGVFSLALLTGMLALSPAVNGRTQTDAQAPADDAAAPVLAPNAPKSYTVKPGDTLWGIANLFLRDPWLWPEIWIVNSQVENPHLIYPGDVLTLGQGADGRPQLTLERGSAMSGDGIRLSPKVRSAPLAGAIAAIPYAAVAAFMSKPMVLEKSQIKSAPHVVSSRDQHLATAAGHTIYSTELEGDVGARYAIVHVGEAMRDPDDRDVIGYQGIYAAEAKITRAGDPTTLEITDSPRETFDGDLLFPTDVEVQMDFIPHAPETEVDGRVMRLVNAISMAGQYQAVVINRGKKHGVEPGHVLALYQAGATVRDRSDSMDTTKKSTFGSKVKLPDEPAGTMMIFKAFDRISYGLILQSQVPIRELDRVGNP